MVFCTWTQFPKKKERGKNPIPPSILHTNTFHKRNKREEKKNPKKGPKIHLLICTQTHSTKRGGKGKRKKKKEKTQSTQTYRPPKKEK